MSKIGDDVSRMSMKELQREVRRLRQDNANLKAQLESQSPDRYTQGYVNGWNDAVDFTEVYKNPAWAALNQMNAYMGMIYGMYLAGRGDLRITLMKTVANWMASAISEFDMQDARLRQAWKIRGGTDIGSGFDIQPALDLRKAVKRFYSGADNGESIIEEIMFAQGTKDLMELRMQENAPGAQPKPVIGRLVERGLSLIEQGANSADAFDMIVDELSKQPRTKDVIEELEYMEQWSVRAFRNAVKRWKQKLDKGTH